MNQLVTYNSLVGYELEKARKQLGIEQAELAARCDMSQPVLSRLERGKASITIDQLFILCRALGVSPEQIVHSASIAVDAIQKEDSVEVKTTKEIGTTGALLTGAAIGAILTLLLSKNK